MPDDLVGRGGSIELCGIHLVALTIAVNSEDHLADTVALLSELGFPVRDGVAP